ncbi:MAG: hypothetical protein ACREM9_10065, partial [Gemmatimonadales bacterium]
SLLPAVSLPSAPAGAMVDLRRGRGPRVVVALHSAVCEECRRYVRAELAAHMGALTEWGGHLLVVVPGVLESAADFPELTPDVQVLGDPELTFASGDAIVAVADEWGEVYFAAIAGAEHAFPTPEEITEWVRLIAIQCPECEGPEGEWKTV